MLGLIGLVFAHDNAAAVDAAAVDIHAVLKTADESRGNVEGISWEVIIESVEDQKMTDTISYDIKARGFDISGMSLAPPKSKGNKLLMSNNTMWFYKPGLNKPIAIAQRQKLMGLAAYGDIASTNYAEDYEANMLPDETIDGEPCYVFDLKSKNSSTTYDRIKYWVSQKRTIGVKAEYFTVSGKMFKIAKMTYDNQVVIGGNERPFISQITMYDELMSGDITHLNLTKPKIARLPDYVFNINQFMK
ncbi:MAG: outer membrane lipoprotein-sorting protein [Candidatus Binatia bacterium]